MFKPHTVATPLTGSVNGISRAGIVLEEVRCNGTEDSIFDCPISTLGSVTNPQCQFAAAVYCARREKASAIRPLLKPVFTV